MLGVSVGETLTTQMGWDWCITQGNVLVNRVSKALSALLCMLHQQLLPTVLHAPNTQTKQSIWIKANPSHGKARGPACPRGLTSPSPLKNTRILPPAIPRELTGAATAQTQDPCRSTYFVRKPSQVARLSRGGRSQQEGLPHPRTSGWRGAD